MSEISALLCRLCIVALCVGCAPDAMTADSPKRANETTAASAIARSEYVQVDAARLFLNVRGADRRAPVLLWLHGGPGGAERPLFRYYDSALEKRFVVAYWDQRGTA